MECVQLFRFHSSSRYSLRFLALAALASTRLGNPSLRQKAARLRPEPMLRHASPCAATTPFSSLESSRVDQAVGPQSNP